MTKSLSLRATALLLVGAVVSACQSIRPRDDTVADPDREVAEIQREWSGLPGEGGASCDPQTAATRAALRQRAESVAFQHPSSASARMLCAVLAYEASDPVAAQRHLDDLLASFPAHADAVCLRARIAMEEGNTAYARRLLEDRIPLRPDHAGLREALAAALYLSGDLAGAGAALSEAERLGAPQWRTAYDRGLIAEAADDKYAAAALYRTAIAHKPDWQAPRLRLRGMGLPEAVPAPVVIPASAPAAGAAASPPAPAAPAAPAAEPK